MRLRGEIHIDVSDALAKYAWLESCVEPGKVRQKMKFALFDAARKVKNVLGEDIPLEYEVGGGWVRKDVKSPKSEGPLRVVVPVAGTRGTIGGVFAASGGGSNVRGTQIHLSNGTVKQRKGFRRGGGGRIMAKIVKGGVSILPDKLPNQGGNAPFFIGGLVFTRTSASRFPIASVVGLSVPIMAENRSQPKIERDVTQVLDKRMQAFVNSLFG